MVLKFEHYQQILLEVDIHLMDGLPRVLDELKLLLQQLFYELQQFMHSGLHQFEV